MKRCPLASLAPLFVAVACGGGETAPSAAQPGENLSPATPADIVPPPPQPDPWRERLASRVLAPSGLGVGARLVPFTVMDTASAEVGCHVCRLGSRPKLMAVGTIDDPEFHEDLQDLDAITKKYEGAFDTFAVLTEIRDGRGRMPADAEAMRPKAQALAKRLRIAIPIVIPVPGDEEPHPVWDEYYNITRSRTIMFADADDEVVHSAVAPEDFSALNAAISSLVDR